MASWVETALNAVIIDPHAVYQFLELWVAVMWAAVVAWFTR